MPIREVTVTDGRVEFLDRAIDRDAFGPGSKMVVTSPQFGWYRRVGDARMVHMGDVLHMPPKRPDGADMVGKWEWEGPLGYQVFVPDPQDQPGVPRHNDWLTPQQKAQFLRWNAR